MSILKEMSPIFVRDNLTERDLQERGLIEDLMARSSNMLLSDIEKEIAEIEYGKPVHLIGNIGIRPFWRDGIEAPPLPVSKFIKILQRRAITSSQNIGRVGQ